MRSFHRYDTWPMAVALWALLLLGCSPHAPVVIERGRPAQPQVVVARQAAPAPAWRAGAVPDFAALSYVISHERSVDMVPELNPLLEQLLGAKLLIARNAARDADAGPHDLDAMDQSLVWMRDYQPLYVREESGALVALRYLSDNPNRVAYKPETSAATSRSLPILHEQGNLVTTGSLVFVTRALVEENSVSASKTHLLDHGYRPRTRDELVGLLARALHRAPDEIVVMPEMPYEATGHIDIYLLPIGPETVIIPAIRQEGLDLVDDPAVRRIGKVIQVFLDEQADRLAARGLEVLRMPMIPPMVAFDEAEEHGAEDGDNADGDLLVFTPANSLLLNMGDHKYVALPGFIGIADNPRMTALIARYTSKWKRAFRERGWEPHVVDAGELVSHLGLLRCVTAVVPR